MRYVHILIALVLFPSLLFAGQGMYPIPAVYVIGGGEVGDAWPEDPAGSEYIYVDTDYAGGASDGSESDPYTSLSLAEAQIGNPGTCENVGSNACVIVVSASAGTADTTQVAINGFANPTAEAPLIIRPDEGQRHNGVWDDSIYSLMTVGKAFSMFEKFVTLRGLQISGSASGAGINSENFSGYATIDSCIIKDSYYGIFNSNNATTAGGSVFSNNIIYNIGRAGIRATGGVAVFDDKNYVINNTIYEANTESRSDMAGINCNAGGSQTFVRNNIVMDSNVADIISCNNADIDYNIISDTTGVGINTIEGVLLEDIDFISTTSGSEDLHITATSAANGVGVDLSGIPEESMWDIDAESRQTPFEMGADQL